MSNALGVFNIAGDPTAGGTQADIGQKAYDVLTGLTWVKTGSADTAWALASLIFGGLFHGVAGQVFSTAGANTYTPTAGMKYCLVFITGGGGGGGGADTDASSGTVAVGGGGGASPTRIGVFSAADVGVSLTVTIGAAGTAGANTGGNGGNGGNTTFGALMTSVGGSGANGSGASAAVTAMQTDGGSGGGIGSGGLFFAGGSSGGTGWAVSCDGTTDAILGQGGQGGASFWANATALARASNNLGVSSATTGRNGFLGGGGGGGVCLSAAGGVAGGAGGGGFCFVLEFLGPA